MTYESLSDGGFADLLGSGGFIVYDDTACEKHMEFFSFLSP
jgi:hypothetical protein